MHAAVLALLHLGLHQGSQTWKYCDWDGMARLHQKASSRPLGNTKSVTFTVEGLRESEPLFEAVFGKPGS